MLLSYINKFDFDSGYDSPSEFVAPFTLVAQTVILEF